MERDSIKPSMKPRSVKDLMKLRITKKSKFMPESEILDAANVLGVHLIDPKTCLKIIKRRVREDLKSKTSTPTFSEEEISHFVNVFERQNTPIVKTLYLDMLEELRKKGEEDKDLKKLAKKGFPVEGIFLGKVADVEKKPEFKKFLDLTLEHSAFFDDIPEEELDDHIRQNARAFNEITAYAQYYKKVQMKPQKEKLIISTIVNAMAAFLTPFTLFVPPAVVPAISFWTVSIPLSTSSLIKRRQIKNEPLIEKIQIPEEKKDMTLKDATTVLNSVISLPYSKLCKNKKLEAYVSNLLNLKVKKDESIADFIPQISKLWTYLGDPTPEKIQSVNTFFDNLSEDVQRKILSDEKCKNFVSFLGSESGLRDHLEDLKQSKPKKGYEHIEVALGIPAELVDSIAELDLSSLSSKLGSSIVNLVGDLRLGNIGRFDSRNEQGIDLSYRGRKKISEDEASPRLESFEDGANVYSVSYPNKYWEIATGVAVNLESIDKDRFRNLIRSIMDKNRMLLSACVAERDKAKLEAMKKAVKAGETPGFRFIVTKDGKPELVSPKVTKKEALGMVAHKVSTPDRTATHYDVIKTVLKDFKKGGKNRRDLEEIQKHIESLATAKKIIESKIGK